MSESPTLVGKIVTWVRERWRWDVFFLALLLAYPAMPGVDAWLSKHLSVSIGPQIPNIFAFGVLVLGLNVVAGYSGLLQLGVAAFYGIGAYTTGILTVEKFPFQLGFWGALPFAVAIAAAAGVVLSAPTLRLRGDYLAIVTMGFGEVVRVSMLNLENITGGSKGLNPIPPPTLNAFGLAPDWTANYRWFYYLFLFILVLVVLLLRNLERSRLGRAWMAIREDELAATCMGVNPVKAKLSAFAMGAALAGLAGALYATKLTTTAEPNTYDFSVSIIALCCVIIGGLGSIEGALLGAFVLKGFDDILSKTINAWLQKRFPDSSTNVFLSANNWRLLLFGMALILVMRFRPEGLLPSKRMKEELHPGT